MKNSNLLNRLLSYSHEKQKMGGMRRYAAMLMMLLTLGVGQMGAYDYTVYCVPEWIWGDAWSDSGTDWVRVNYQKNNSDTWGQVSMTKTELRYNGYDIYKATIGCKYDGVDNLQFQRMASGSDSPCGTCTYGAINSWWQGNNWNNKLYNKSWIDLTYDTYDISASTTIYFDNTETNWSDVSMHMVKSDYLGYDTYTHIEGTPYWYREYTTAWENFGAAIFYEYGFTHQSGRIYQDIGSGVVCFTPNSGDNYTGFTTTAPVGPKNIAISNNGTTIVRGTEPKAIRT